MTFEPQAEADRAPATVVIPDEAPEASRLVRSSVAVAAGTLLSRLSGLAKFALLAYAIGRGTLADTYGIANSTPNIVYELVLGGVLAATLVPVFVDFRNDERATSAIFTVGLSVLAMLTLVALLAAPWIADLYFRDPDPGQREVATTLVRLLIPQMIFYGLTALATAVLNARRRFVAAAFAPVLNNLVVIAMILTFVAVTSGPREGWEDVATVEGDGGLLLLLGLGTTAGIVVMGLALVPAMLRAGIRIRPTFAWRHAAVRRVIRLSSWTIGYVIANQIALLVVMILAAGESGAIAAYQLAFLFLQLPHGLFAVSIMTTVMPELARSADDPDRYRERFGWGLRLLVLVVLPAAAAYAVLEEPLVGLMRFGAFDGGDVMITAEVVEAFALGLVAFSAYLFTMRGFYALQDTRTPFFINLGENALNIVLAAVLWPWLGVAGLALSFSLSYIVGAAVAYALLAARTGGLDGHRTLATAWRSAVASLGLAATAGLIADVTWDGTPSSGLVTLVGAGGAGLVAYVSIVWALRTPGLGDLRGAIGPGARTDDVDV